MHTPEFVIRVQIDKTDVDTLREWWVMMGGAQRGGMTAQHGYIHTEGPLVDEDFSHILTSVTDLLTAYACGLGGVQLTLDD